MVVKTCKATRECKSLERRTWTKHLNVSHRLFIRNGPLNTCYWGCYECSPEVLFLSCWLVLALQFLSCCQNVAKRRGKKKYKWPFFFVLKLDDGSPNLTQYFINVSGSFYIYHINWFLFSPLRLGNYLNLGSTWKQQQGFVFIEAGNKFKN